MDTRTDKYLTRYADRYRVKIGEDGCAYIQTRFKPDPWGMTYEIYVYSDELLAVCLPPRTARSLMKRFPGRFRKHQDAGDGVVLLFPESELDEWSDVLRIRRCRVLSEKERQRLVTVGARYRFGNGVERTELDPESTNVTRPGVKRGRHKSRPS